MRRSTTSASLPAAAKQERRSLIWKSKGCGLSPEGYAPSTPLQDCPYGLDFVPRFKELLSTGLQGNLQLNFPCSGLERHQQARNIET